MAFAEDSTVLDRVLNPQDANKRSTIIFLHGLGDDGHGAGYGLAQQFQMYNKLLHTKWVLPTAKLDNEVGERCWYKPHDLPSPLKPRVPGDHEVGEVDEEEDEDGILKTVDLIDGLVEQEIADGVDPSKIVVGGFSQGCAVSTIWGLKGKHRSKVAGVYGLSGYFPKIKSVNDDALSGTEAKGHAPQWFFAHGMADRAVATNLFAEGQKRLQELVDKDKVEGHVYQDLAHTIAGPEIRDIWLWFKKVLKEEE
ncbi:Phospholipase/carboxylesterase/thioesterase [Elsinoe ampelina]|uniref:Acyl-protein thioesterase 1 n=1 Tax=Elsinoe ampelina TaxID=302913 RepID=A0A6A6GKH6_9PEZI|nr:Phospholipase/carboxylesterase/thioesterase [Elsinoe ampelina]